jgi:hypothetical protein
VPVISEIIYSESFLQQKLDTEFFMQSVAVSPQQIELVAKQTKQTIGQRDNPMWTM